MPVRQATRPVIKESDFKNTLLHSVQIGYGFLAVALILVFLLGFFFSTQRSNQEQAKSQVSRLAASYADQLNQIPVDRQLFVNYLAQSDSILTAFTAWQSDPTNADILANLDQALQSAEMKSSTPGQLLILNPQGQLVGTTQAEWRQEALDWSAILPDLKDSGVSRLSFGDLSDYPGQILVITNQALGQGEGGYQLVEVSPNPLINFIATNFASQYPNGQFTFFIRNDFAVDLAPNLNGFIAATILAPEKITSLFGPASVPWLDLSPGAGQAGPAYAYSLSALNAAFSIRVPAAGFSLSSLQINSLAWLSILLLALLFAGYYFLILRKSITPLAELSRRAEKLVNGAWTGHIAVQRKDEAGRLAFMLNALSDRLEHTPGIKNPTLVRALKEGPFPSADEGISAGQELVTEPKRTAQQSEFITPLPVNQKDVDLLKETIVNLHTADNETSAFGIVSEMMHQMQYISAIFDLSGGVARLAHFYNGRGLVLDNSLKGFSIPFEDDQGYVLRKEYVVITPALTGTTLQSLFKFFKEYGSNVIAVFPIETLGKAERILVLGPVNASPFSQVTLELFSILVKKFLALCLTASARCES